MAQQQRVKVLRGFRHKQEIQGPTTVLDLDMGTARELRSCNKVEFVSSDTKLTHTTALPDPNKILAERQANRAANLAALSRSAEKQAAAAAGGK
jgi:hypothetical protein